MPGVPWHTQILADQLTLFQPGGTDCAHLITTGTPKFSDLPTALYLDTKLLTHPNVPVQCTFFPCVPLSTILPLHLYLQCLVITNEKLLVNILKGLTELKNLSTAVCILCIPKLGDVC